MKTETKHTPGPWKAYHRHIVKPDWQFTHNQWIDHAIADMDEGPTKEEAIANARLIAAAPEMLELLQQAIEQWGEAISQDYAISGSDAVDWLNDFIPNARAAITKAEGKE